MPTLADCPPNATKEELSKWWKQKQTEFWWYKKLSGPDADEYRHQESAHVKWVLSHKKIMQEDDRDGADDVSILDDSNDNGAEDSDVNPRCTKCQEQSRIR